MMSVRDYVRNNGNIGVRKYLIIGENEMTGLKHSDEYFVDNYYFDDLNFRQFELLSKILAFKYECVRLHYGTRDLINLETKKPKNPKKVKYCNLMSASELRFGS